MLRKLGWLFLLFLLAPLAAAPAPTPERPRLVLLLVMDQFRQEYLVRHRASFTSGGFNLLLERGAVFANCHYAYATTLTAASHAVIATGAYPNATGIIGNEWFDRASGRHTTAERDPREKLLGAESASPGVSPHWLIGSTLADELRLAGGGQARVISISPKARSAVLLGGMGANAAYWFDGKTVHAVSSTYYMDELPSWVLEFNAENRAEQYAGKPWVPVDNPKGEPFLVFPKAAGPSERQELAEQIIDSPFAMEIQFALARAAVEKEKLGSGRATDLLALSLSSIDEVGHILGPDAPGTRDTILRADRAVADFLRFLDRRIGLANVWVAFSADHGIAPLPEVAQQYRLRAGRVSRQTVVEQIESKLNQAYAVSPGQPAGGAEEKWVVYYSPPHLYLNQKRIRQRRLDAAQVARRAAEALLELEGIGAVFTRAELAGCRGGTDLLGKVCLAYYFERGGDLFVVFQPYWMHELSDHPKGTWHGTHYSYDTHVPLLLWGAPFRAGIYYTPSSPADLSVTLAAALGINAPPLATGRVLAEALQPAANNSKSQIRNPKPVPVKSGSSIQ